MFKPSTMDERWRVVVFRNSNPSQGLKGWFRKRNGHPGIKPDRLGRVRPTDITKAADRIAQTIQRPVLFALRTHRI